VSPPPPPVQSVPVARQLGPTTIFPHMGQVLIYHGNRGVREIKEKVKVREIIIPLLQFDIYVSLAEAITGKTKPTKNRAIKAIIKNQLFKVTL
jgi:hypothetical protein